MISCDLCKKSFDKEYIMNELQCCEKSKNSKRCIECYDKTVKGEDKLNCNFCNSDFIVISTTYNFVQYIGGLTGMVQNGLMSYEQYKRMTDFSDSQN